MPNMAAQCRLLDVEGCGGLPKTPVLGRRDYAAAEAAAREVLANRNAARGQDAQILLGDALQGKRDFQNAALAYDDAYRRSRASGRAPTKSSIPGTG